LDLEKLLNSRTVLEYLVLMNQDSYAQIGKKLNITSQQFSDWIKKRRPIPEERLKNLSNYFGIDESYLVDESKYTRDLNHLNQIDIQIILFNQKIEAGVEETEGYKEKIRQLEKEKTKQIRIARLTSILNKEDERINVVIDKVLELIESGDFEKLGGL
jgi:transcriptional regulator with XRE-family HTH domain